MWLNSIMAGLLRSPLHGLLGKNTLLMTYTGRKSGKVYSTPMNYVRLEDVLLTTSYRERTWWRNLRGGAEVTVRVQGHLQAQAEVIEDDAGVAAGLGQFLQLAPAWAKAFHVKLAADGKPLASDVTEAARTRVVVRTRLPKH
jgi:deazaflavin-dependent oxidoreductase (nitroreductase family)